MSEDLGHAYFEKAWIYFIMKKYEESVETYKKGIQYATIYFPGNTKVMIAYLNNLGIAKTKINNSIDAIDHFFKCI